MESYRFGEPNGIPTERTSTNIAHLEGELGCMHALVVASDAAGSHKV